MIVPSLFLGYPEMIILSGYLGSVLTMPFLPIEVSFFHSDFLGFINFQGYVKKRGLY